jgi:hypothetical protein
MTMKRKLPTPIPITLEERIANQKEEVIEFLDESGNISFACKKARISRETYYRWRDDAGFAAKADSAIKSGKTYVNDLAHTQLIRKIQEGDMQAIRFHLVNCHDDYRPKLPERIERVVPITAVEIIQASHDCKKESNAEQSPP